jgi:hypothetical protein
VFIRSQEFAGDTNIDDDRDVNSPIATFQNEAFRSHAHTATLDFSGNTSSDGNHRHNNRLNGGANGVGGWKEATDAWDPAKLGMRVTNRSAGDLLWIQELMDYAGTHYHTFSGKTSGDTKNSGGNETRPDNLNFWVYIRIN